MVRNESVRFGRHIDIEVSYKTLQLEVPKNAPILQNPPCFQYGYFEAIFVKNTLGCLGANWVLGYIPILFDIEYFLLKSSSIKNCLVKTLLTHRLTNIIYILSHINK
jgi:hypothetical protein